MTTITSLLGAAQARATAQSLPYSGALLPQEAFELLKEAPGARLIDVRSRAELELTGMLPGAIHVEWQSWPGWVPNPHFIVQLRQAVDPEGSAAVHLPQRPAIPPRRHCRNRSRTDELLQCPGRIRGRPRQGQRSSQ
jgi:hypothetical protein